MLLASGQRRPGNLRQVHFMTSYISSYHALLIVDMDSIYITIGSLVCTCIASLPHVRKKVHFIEFI